MAMEIQQGAAGASVGPPPKFSRYRSVRQAASQKQAAPPLPLSAPNGAHSGVSQAPAIAKSMSRYRRAKPAPSVPTNELQPPVPTAVERRPEDKDVIIQGGGCGIQSGIEGRLPIRTSQDSDSIDDKAEELELERERHRQEAMARLTGGESLSAPSMGGGSSRPTTRGTESRDQKNKKLMKVKEREREREQQDVKKKAAAETDAKHLSFKEKLSLPWSKGPEAKHSKPDAKYIEVGGGGIVPGIDAPVSAVNAGERRVVVQYRGASIRLPITPSTRAQDLLFSAANCLGQDIDPKKFILMESFAELGLERPLRRYEHIRDVMNSWAHDGEHSLFITPPSSVSALKRLDASGVPAEQPEDATFSLYYSQRPRKWDKRFVTLRTDGQVSVSKKERAQEQTNVCHLSDFDIYTPTPHYLAKKVKPPKKICFAVKSQQKSSMFLSTENFAHFFATNDRDLADRWHNAVQQWRSWYLVNKLGAGQKKPDEAQGAESKPPTSASVSRQTSRHRKGMPSESTPYQLGAFKPLLDMDSLEYASGDDQATHPPSSSHTKDLFARKKSTREHAPPPASFPKKLSEMDAATFAPTGLLGRSYSQRQRAMWDREEKERRMKQPDSAEPFSPQGGGGGGGSSSGCYPASNPASRSNTMRSAQAPDLSGFVRRSDSLQRPKPLVDLTPVFQEPPQHARKGRGVTIEPGVPLVEAATGPELPTGAIEVPSATTWRRPAPPPLQSSTTTTAAAAAAGTNNYSRQHGTGGANGGPAVSPTSPTSPESPFVPNSLLARSAKVPTHAPGIPTGHGVATGDRTASKPMLDMTPKNPFIEGSLLHDL
ncbi:hypothetical protein ASPZODRAFT_2120900 [Penicilliopsis zonata CBS 506.65]|uniref:PH domain-containing protein n=1 Tax=Penicilliopsis zonata CBS 506.65 TaxID=1073090 RepID=A0A1L9SP51_9EURO|nr:hypothetical protein ASPZODRAFT_2120900 [Penicilliopsis zonata CBS 506.65]OJJ49032.1 hypothetical protein ASPZODRAFT_2120900 [Penicilliopsis zonata CBS 506.65]